MTDDTTTEDHMPADKILGVDRKIIEAFLELFRDKFFLVDHANYFLESRAGSSGLNIAIVNQRDFASHFCTVLKNPDFTERQHLDQLSAAEEHLRRAIIECYQRSVSIKLVTISDLLEEYKERVVPNVGKKSALQDALGLDEINTKINEIKKLHSEGRSAKNINKWDDEWLEGVNKFIDSFLLAEELENALESHLSKSPRISNIWKLIGLISALINILLLAFLLLRWF